ncbi:MAG: alkaline phosphatase family protein [Gemmatimonadota bacterium]|nr:alkaline phosphatase family protein [Gemmatimonadota bacterium]MDP6528176.1 alkaline phosphatase family protein [Gemmatimonadota bacterium]MDP6801786.1 alkaline phosphatase family protein [Gemmatimonadota bacterium]MDP7031138.1 alkaline phosphatase family protein [Gemmatimonadota bacterium]
MRGSGFVAFAACAVVVVSAASCSSPEAERPPRSTVVALDGADWRLALPLVRQGKLPVLSALLRAGASGIMLSNPDYSWSPVLWTTIATGRLPERHGVTAFMTSVPGMDRKIPTPSTSRTCRALWNLFSESGRTAGFVGWWVTWPAEEIRGFMVSDHFSVSRFDLGRDFEREVEEPVFQARQTWPEELAAELAPLRVPRDSIGVDDLSRFADLPDGYRFPDRFRKFDKVSEFSIAHSVDRTHHAAGMHLLRRESPELFGVFYEGVDVLQHFLWEDMDPEGAGTAPSVREREIFGETIERYYAFADGMIGELVEAGGSERAVMIVSDHGFQPSTERYEKKGISGEHRRQSFFLFAGPGVRRGVRADSVDAIDITPTILVYHGLPWGEDMDGVPAARLLRDDWRAAHPVRSVPTWETGPWKRPELPEDPATRDLEERIRSLGYIE